MTRFVSANVHTSAADASCSAPAARCAASACCAATMFELISDTAVLAVSVFISLLLCLCGLIGLIEMLVISIISISIIMISLIYKNFIRSIGRNSTAAPKSATA